MAIGSAAEQAQTQSLADSEKWFWHELHDRCLTIGWRVGCVCGRRSVFARLNICRFSISCLRSPSTLPALQGVLRPAMTASRSLANPLANVTRRGSAVLAASAIHWWSCFAVSGTRCRTRLVKRWARSRTSARGSCRWHSWSSVARSPGRRGRCGRTAATRSSPTPPGTAFRSSSRDPRCASGKRHDDDHRSTFRGCS